MFPFLILRLVLALIDLSFPSPAYGQEPPTPLIQITEVYTAPASGESEWFELYNPGSVAVDLAGWQVFDQLTNPSLIYEIKSPEERWLLPGQHRVFTLAAAKLNNAADGVTVIDSCQTQVDQMSYNQPASSTQSWSLYNSTWVLAPPSPGAATTTLPPTPTPTPTLSPTPTPPPTATPTPSPSPTPTTLTENYIAEHLLLSEVMSCPSSGDKEWIELFWNSPESATIANWQLADAAGTIYSFSAAPITPESFVTVELPSARLNNSGDSLSLISPSGQEIWSVLLPACSVGNSFIFSSGALVSTTTPSPGQSNPDPATSTASLSLSIASSATSSATTSSSLPAPSLTPTSQLNQTTQTPQPSSLNPYPGRLPQLTSLPTDENSQTAKNPPESANPIPALLNVILGGLLLVVPNGLMTALHAQKHGFINFHLPLA